MMRFVAKRLALSVIVLFIALMAVFFISSMIGDPARLILPPEATEEQYQAMRQQLGLNDPIWEQFGRNVTSWLQGDFGNSLYYAAPALDIVLDRLPATLLLAAATLLVAIPIAIALAVLSARRPGSFLDRTLTTVSLAGVSFADFWVALMLILAFAVTLNWLPTSGYGGPAYFVLPVITLMLRPLGRIAQVSRAALVDEMHKQYPLTARSKGLSDTKILYRHALRNSAIAMATIAGAEAISLLNGAVVVESVFGWPGIGSLFIDSIQQRDLPLIQASVALVAVMVILVNLVVDLLYAVIDPRIRDR